jgi:hypothetical protein
MHIVSIVIYCLIAAVLLFGITFHDEMLNESRRKKTAHRLILIDGGKSKLRRRA